MGSTDGSEEAKARGKDAAARGNQSVGEEIANSITHGIGAALGVAALALLVVFGSIRGDAWRIVGFSIYGATLIVLYISSALYHALTAPRAKRVFWALDHSSIYLLIAGTYTPVILATMRDAWGWTIFGLIWAMAAGGIVFRIFASGKLKLISVLLYVAMGWLAIIAIEPMVRMLPAGLIAWLLVGGACYTLGVAFYLWKRLPFGHAVWHLFVLAGSISHFFGMMLYLVPRNA